MKGKKIKVTAAVLIIAGAASAFVYFRKNAAAASADEASAKELEYTVAKGNISVSVSESGMVNPVDKRSVKSEIAGTVDKVYVTEGDTVAANQILLSLKSDKSDDVDTELADINLNVEKLQKDLSELYENSENLNICSPISGIVSDLKIESGDSINGGSPIASIKDTDNSYIEVYFTKEQYENISVGDTASVFMPKSFETCTGSITEKNSTPVQMGGGIFGYLVTAKISNPGGFSTGDTAQVSVTNSKGTYQAIENGSITDVKDEKVTPKVSGKIKSVAVENGAYINKGDVIATLDGSDMEYDIAVKQNSIQKYTSQISDMLEGNIVYSPMDGTVLSISVSEDEVVDRSTALMTVADMDNMEVTISVDELDINKISLGQKATISSDTYPDDEITGTVTKISLEGKTSNSVTTYDVTVKLDDRKSLMSGMNVDVEIISDISEDTLIVPIEAVHRHNSDYMVTVKDSLGNTKDVVVEMGLATDDQVEITSGLNEGDIVVYTPASSDMPTTKNEDMLPGAGGGGMPGGSPNGGGMPGGSPNGGGMPGGGSRQ